MCDADSPQPSLALRVVYEDLPDFVEIHTAVQYQGWTAAGTAYAAPSDVSSQARSLLTWSLDPAGECRFEIGGNSANGSLSQHFAPVDLSGHCVCHIQLTAGGESGAVPMGRKWRVSLEIPVEPGQVESFARQLVELGERRRDAAQTG